jgi:hypothetical protein
MSTREHRNCAELLDAYAAGQRDFSGWLVRHGVLVRERFEGCHFDGAEFHEITAALPVFENCCLDEAAFTHSVLIGTSFLSSSMRRCRFDTCTIDRSDFFRTSLTGSSLQSCSLDASCFLHADLSQCKIYATKFAGSLFGRTAFTVHTLLDADFGDSIVALPHRIAAVELQEIQATAYAMLSLTESGEKGQADVIRWLFDGLPRIVDFLERGGVGTDWLLPLRNAISLASAAPKRSVFISYATEDQALVEQLVSVFERAGLDVWFAPHSMRGGRKLDDQLMRAVDARDRVVFVASPAAMASSWVQFELRRALATPAMADARRVVPVLLTDDARWHAWRLIDPDSGRDLAAELRYGRTYSLRGEEVDATLRELIDELTPKAAAAATPSP